MCFNILFPVEISFCHITFKFILFIYLWMTHKTSLLLLIKQLVHVDARHFFHVTIALKCIKLGAYAIGTASFFVQVSSFLIAHPTQNLLGLSCMYYPGVHDRQTKFRALDIASKFMFYFTLPKVSNFDVLNHIIYDCNQSNYSGINMVHTCTMHNSPYNEMAAKY